MNRHELSEIENVLLQDATGAFEDSELEGLHDPVQRFLRTAIAPGTERWNEGEFFRYRIMAMTPVISTAH